MQVQRKSTLNSSQFIQSFYELNSSHRIYYCDRFTKSKFDEKYVNTMESTTSNVWNKTF